MSVIYFMFLIIILFFYLNTVKGWKIPDKELKKPNEDSIQNTRRFGEFHLRISFNTEDYKIKEFKDLKI